MIPFNIVLSTCEFNKCSNISILVFPIQFWRNLEVAALVFFSCSSCTNSSRCPFILPYLGVGQSAGEIRPVWLMCKYWSFIFYKNLLVGECCMKEALLYWRSQLCSHHCSRHFFCPASCRCSNMMGIHNSVYYLNEGTHNAPNLNRQ